METMSPHKRRVEHQAPRCSCRGCRKMNFGTLDFFLRFLRTTLVRELRFSGPRTPPLLWRSAVLLSVLSVQTKHLVACVCFVFPLRLPYFLNILLCTPRNTSGYRVVGKPQNSCCNNAAAAAAVTSCVFPNSFLRNIKRHGGDAPPRSTKCQDVFSGDVKNEIWHP